MGSGRAPVVDSDLAEAMRSLLEIRGRGSSYEWEGDFYNLTNKTLNST
jgi:hypothetical protein